MIILKRIGVTIASLAALLVVGDLVGVAMCFFGDLIHPASWSVGAIYATWFTLGVLVGFVHYMAVQGYCNPALVFTSVKFEPSASAGVLSIVVTVPVLYGLSMLFYKTGWERGVSSSDGYVPDNMSATMTYFGSIVAAMCFMLWAGATGNSPNYPKSRKKKKHGGDGKGHEPSNTTTTP